MISNFLLSFKKVLILFFGVLFMTIAIPRGLAQNIVFNIDSFSETSPQWILAQSSQQKSPDSTTKTQITSNIKPANVTLDGEILFTIEAKLGEVSPKERARSIDEKLIRIAQDDSITIDSIRAIDLNGLEDWKLIQAEDILILTLTPDDVKSINKPPVALGVRSPILFFDLETFPLTRSFLVNKFLLEVTYPIYALKVLLIPS